MLIAFLLEAGIPVYPVNPKTANQLCYREEARRKQFRFRKDLAAYLAALEAQLLE